MITARKNRLIDALFYRYVQRKLRQRFHGVYLRGGSHFAALPANRPVIAFANHTNWWDLLMLFRLTRCIPRKACFGMMEERNLRHYRFFRALGVFSIDLDSKNGARALGGLRYALRLLTDPRHLVWIFPQGQLCTPYEPVEIRPGLPFLIRHTPQAMILPVAFRYEFFRDDLPIALIEVADPIPAAEASSERCAEVLQHAAQRLEITARTRDLSDFTPLSQPALHLNKKWEWIRRTVQGQRAGFDPAN